jgi:hypothetical protein
VRTEDRLALLSEQVDAMCDDIDKIEAELDEIRDLAPSLRMLVRRMREMEPLLAGLAVFMKSHVVTSQHPS